MEDKGRLFKYGDKWHRVGDTVYHRGIGYTIQFIGFDCCAVVKNDNKKLTILGHVYLTRETLNPDLGKTQIIKGEKMKVKIWDNEHDIMCGIWDIYELPDWIGATYHNENIQMDEKRYTLLFYTGLNDSKGKENYNGDLLKDTRNNLIFRIHWNEKYAGWWCVSEDLTIETSLADINQYCENIGSVYENVEMEN